jgi:hypothetical protein
MSAKRYVGGPPHLIAMAIASILWTMEPQISAPRATASWFPAPKPDAAVSAAPTG